MTVNMLDLVGVHEVSLTRRRKDKKLGVVHNGAMNEHADVLIWKSAHEADATKEGQMPETELERALADLAEADTTIAEKTAEIARLEKALAAKEVELKVRDKDLGETKTLLDRELAKNADPEEELLKMMPEAAQKAYLAQKATTERLEKRMREADEQAKLAEIAKTFDAEFDGLPIKGDAAAPILKAAYSVLDEDQAKELRRVLKAGSDAAKDLMRVHGQLGHGGFEKSSTEAQVDKMARERAAKDGISFEKAYAAVLSEQPELYAKMDAERTAH